jgi:FkbM family methyltransferase
MTDRFYQQPPMKTRFLNIFRQIFTLPFFEAILIKKVLANEANLWKKCIPLYYLFPENSFRKVSRNGISYELNISHAVDHAIYFNFKDSTFDHVLADISAAKVIFDIGSNISSTALFFSKTNTQNAQIFTFEPHKTTYLRGLQNIKLNQANNIFTHNFGLGDKKDTFKLYEVDKRNPGMNRIIEAENAYPFIDISIVKLDDFIEENGINRLDFMKIDVEGFEYQVIKGGENALKTLKPTLFIELDDNNLRANGKSAVELMHLLKSLGYSKILNANSLNPIDAQFDFTNCHFDIVVK